MPKRLQKQRAQRTAVPSSPNVNSAADDTTDIENPHSDKNRTPVARHPHVTATSSPEISLEAAAFSSEVLPLEAERMPKRLQKQRAQRTAVPSSPNVNSSADDTADVENPHSDKNRKSVARHPHLFLAEL
mmetsp:Transcript_64933/g.121705  ORF Transcript_64933/g.121705 Transcript_64933/m.121705 type:complete len:130 (-) Transcript_64933:433-822(-)